MFHLLRLISPKGRALLALSIGAGLVSGVANGAMVAVVHRILQSSSELLTGIVSFVGLSVTLMVTRLISATLMVRMPLDTIHELRLRLSRQLIGTPLPKLERLGVGGMFSLLSRQVYDIVAGLGALPEVVVSLSGFIGCMAYMAWLSFPFFVLVLVPTCVLGGVVMLLNVRLNRMYDNTVGIQHQLYELIDALIKGVKELQVGNALRSAFLEEMSARSAQFTDARTKLNVKFHVVNFWSSGAFQLVLGVVLFAPPLLLTSVSPSARLGSTLVFLYLFNFLLMLNSNVPLLQLAAAAHRAVEEVGLALDPPREAADVSGGLELARSLVLKDLAWTCRDEQGAPVFSLGPVSLNLHPGELVFIVGANGSGKSTLGKLVCGLYESEGGEIRVDGAPVTQAHIEDYRQLFAVVFSDFQLFDVLPSRADPAHAVKYLKALQLDHKVDVKNGKFTTTALSQGQRRRLALVVAYLQDRPIYLFDEWAADQDPHFRDVFYKQLLPELKARGKLVVVVTHDERYYPVADRLVRMDYGRLVEDVRQSPPASDPLPGNIAS